jgi:3',5'-cyclic AMP phosphodiesterase CpdA
MLIAQVTDCHVGFDLADAQEDNVRRLRAVLDLLAHGPNRPDLVLLSGDLTNHGESESYARLAALLADYDLWFHFMVGNHDERSAFRAAFPEAPDHEGFVQYELPLPGLRLIALDTIDPGHHGGAFCAERAAWLSAKLDSDPVTPVLIAMHHPPIVSGIDWMDGTGNEAWIARFTAVIEARPQVRAIVAGHLHRAIHTMVAGVPLTVCPASAPAVALDLTLADPDLPDGRAMVVDEPAGYALHRWDGTRLITLIGAASAEGPWHVHARYDAAFQATVRQNAAEREA